MVHLVVVIRTREEIKECILFTRECAQLLFDTLGRRTSFMFPLEQNIPDFWHREYQQATQPVRVGDLSTEIQHLRPHRKVSHIVLPSDKDLPLMSNESESDADHSLTANMAPSTRLEQRFNGQFVVSDDPKGIHTLEASLHQSQLDWQLFVLPRFMCTMMVNGHLASCMAKCIRIHRKFRINFCKKLFRVRAFKDCVPGYFSWGASDSEFEKLDLFAVPYLIDVISVWPEQRLDYGWGWRLNHLLTKRMLLEDAMAWLSTLGGAHSSLGEYFRHHAEMAGQISMKQLRLAMEMGDPFTVARCHMFWAYSLIQRGFTHKAKVIIRRVYHFAAHHPVRDSRLINMTLAAWKRLQHLHRAKGHAQPAEKNNNMGPFRSADKMVCHARDRVHGYKGLTMHHNTQAMVR